MSADSCCGALPCNNLIKVGAAVEWPAFNGTLLPRLEVRPCAVKEQTMAE